jgi:DNA processing protein
VVGSHHADAEGIGEAVRWGKGFAERNVVVVSGLARGIDGGAHTGALAGNGKTVAVLGSGLQKIYPPEHQGLAKEITDHGALLTEYPPATPLTKPRLIWRNRLIVALADAVVVVRIAKATSGSMEAIRRARDLACPTFLVAADTEEASQHAVADGAVPIATEPDFDLILNYL